MKKRSMGMNALLNGFRTFLNLLFPLITFPYISRVLGVTGIGQYNFSLTYISYFLLLAGLGISTYAVREGAKYRDQKEIISSFSSEVYTINFYSTFFSYIVLFLTLLIIPKLKEYNLMILIFSIELIFTTLGKEWLYTIYEDYAYITIRSVAFKVISILMLFIFVKNRNDCYNYAFITVLATVGSNIFNYFHAKKICKTSLVKKVNLRKHLKPILVIFASSVATLIYINSDVTILGFMKNDYVVGIYSVSVKVYSIIKSLLGAVLLVTVPRLSMYYGSGRIEQFEKIFNKVFNLIVLLVFPAMLGIFSVSKDVIYIIAGKNYFRSDSSLKLLSIALVFSVISWLYTSCVLIPAKLEKKVLEATIYSAVLNIILNIALIPFFNENASAFATVIAELLMCVFMISYGRRVVKVRNIKNNLFSVFVGCLFIYLICFLINLLNFPYIVSFVVSVVLSVIVYFTTLLIFKNEILFEELKKILK